MQTSSLTTESIPSKAIDWSPLLVSADRSVLEAISQMAEARSSYVVVIAPIDSSMATSATAPRVAVDSNSTATNRQTAGQILDNQISDNQTSDWQILGLLTQFDILHQIAALNTAAIDLATCTIATILIPSPQCLPRSADLSTALAALRQTSCLAIVNHHDPNTRGSNTHNSNTHNSDASDSDANDSDANDSEPAFGVLTLDRLLITLLDQNFSHPLLQAELDRQAQRDRLFADITLKIRQSLATHEILQTAVQEVHTLLQADRVLIFRFVADGSGVVAQEAAVPGYSTILGQNLYDPCFSRDYSPQYQQGRLSAITDIEQADIDLCHKEFLQQFSVRANLVVPILQQQNLWGLLIAHQCRGPRQWSAFETELLKQLADQIGIALAQAQLLEQETRQRQELARSNAELEQFAYVASHDLQEPLRMITSYLQLLNRRYQNQLDETAQEFIAYAVDGAARMQTLIHDLLDYSRLNRQRQPFTTVDLNLVLQAALDNLKFTIAETQATVTADLLPVVMGDAIQLTQLLQNLIGNAIKFRSTAPPQIHINAVQQAQPAQWLISVQDNGIGIDPAYTDRIFQIFQRLHTRTAHPGTGIGLAICKKIVERHQGQIWVESQPDQGATFYFTLPHTHPQPT